MRQGSQNQWHTSGIIAPLLINAIMGTLSKPQMTSVTAYMEMGQAPATIHVHDELVKETVMYLKKLGEKSERASNKICAAWQELSEDFVCSEQVKLAKRRTPQHLETRMLGWVSGIALIHYVSDDPPSEGCKKGDWDGTGM
ncbi:unnamed protein product [Strongylus vulgaris]|uniref:Uncharacterized protein n=1 Tax=Strongylus vulgaris TaxID=40348 RepID=A0A3P7IFE1_STRVU|nr:unnamed protein product [Strongylus vulgaris]